MLKVSSSSFDLVYLVELRRILLAMGKTFKQVDETERRLVRNMSREKLTWKQVQKITGRSPDTINAILNYKPGAAKPKGAPKKIPVKLMPQVLKVTEKLQKKAKAEQEVTADMISERLGLKVCARTLQRAFHKHGVRFYKLKEKFCLNKDDIVERMAWATVGFLLQLSRKILQCKKAVTRAQAHH